MARGDALFQRGADVGGDVGVMIDGGNGVARKRIAPGMVPGAIGLGVGGGGQR